MRYLVLLFCLPLTLTLYAQERIYEEHVGWRGEEIVLRSVSDSARTQHCLFLCNADSIRGFLLGDKQSILKEFGLHPGKDEEFRGGFIKDGKINIFLQSGSDQQLHVWVLDTAGGALADYTVPFGEAHERAVAQISCGNRFLYFAINNRKSEFAIYDFLPDRRYETLRYHFEGQLWQALNTWDGPGLHALDVAVINPGDQLNPEVARAPNKFYWVRDTLFLVMNSCERGVSWIYSFDLRNRIGSFRKIVHNNARIWNPPLELYKDNSMVLDDRLYFVSAQDTQLADQVRDFYTGKRLATFTAGKNDAINFKNTPILSSFDQENPRELKRTNKLLWEMVSQGAVIMAARQDSGRVGVVVGSWKNKVYGLPPLMLLPVLPILIPGTVAITDYLRAIKSPRFKMLLDTATFGLVPGPVGADVEDAIERLKTGIKCPEHGEDQFENSGKQIFAYYDKRKREIVLVGL
jgi:hypothetical protein